jgi:putative (di)nucleoside polyphosphate hydrolase
VIDSEGYRPNVGIILCNAENRVFWAKRIGQRSWQFPQGGIHENELFSPEQAMLRELGEEIGLQPQHVEILGRTEGWLHYRLPKRLIRHHSKPTCIGQKQVWFLLRMLGTAQDVRLDLSERPEFDLWRWVDYWYPLKAVVPFKRQVYTRALRELAPLLFTGSQTKLPQVAATRPRRFQKR